MKRTIIKDVILTAPFMKFARHIGEVIFAAMLMSVGAELFNSSSDVGLGLGIFLISIGSAICALVLDQLYGERKELLALFKNKTNTK